MVFRAACAQLIVVFVAWGVAGCQSNAGDSDRELADARAQLGRYQKRYGQLSAKPPQHEFRQLRDRMAGKNMQQVTGILGSPIHVVNSGDRESWDYQDVAYDSVTKRTVRNLEVRFKRGVVDDVRASF